MEKSASVAERLREAAQSGQWLDLASWIEDPEEDAAYPGGRDSPRYLPAGAIRTLLLSPDLRVTPHGLKIRRANVIDHLDLAHTTLPCRLVFSQCRFDKSPTFEQAVLPGLVLDQVILPGLTLDSIRVTGDVKSSGLQSHGEVSARRSRVEGELSMQESKLTNAGGLALCLDGADITGGVDLSKAETTGEIRAQGAHIGGHILMREAKLTNGGGRAISLDGADVVGGVYLNKAEVIGEIRAPGAHVGGQFALEEAKLTGSGDSRAVLLDGADITLGLYLGKSEVLGEIRAPGAHFGLQLSLKGARLSNPGRPALLLDGADITGSAYLDEVHTTGGVSAVGTHVHGQFLMREAKLVNPDKKALSLDRAEVQGSVILDKTEATGEIRASGARILGQFSLEETKLTNPGLNALNLAGATLDHLVLITTSISNGGMDLSFSTIRVLSVNSSAIALPPMTDAQGWKIGIIHGFLLTDRKSARSWLETIDTSSSHGRQKEFASQPWNEIADVYDRIGQPEDARWLKYQAAKKTTRIVPLKSKIFRWFYCALVGYGYYPAYITLWLAGIWLAIFIVSSLNLSAFTPTDPTAATVTVRTSTGFEDVLTTGATPGPDDYPPFDARLFAVDTAIPAASTGQADAWQVTGSAWLSWAFSLVRAFSWILTALLLAGITGILRKD